MICVDKVLCVRAQRASFVDLTATLTRSLFDPGFPTPPAASIVLWKNRFLTQNNWTRVGDVFPMQSRPDAVYYRPHVIYNPATKLCVVRLAASLLRCALRRPPLPSLVLHARPSSYILWTNAQNSTACPAGSHGKCYFTATSPTPEGPFRYHVRKRRGR